MKLKMGNKHGNSKIIILPGIDGILLEENQGRVEVRKHIIEGTARKQGGSKLESIF